MFKPGDRVQQKSGGPVMHVLKYAREYNPILGEFENGSTVVCSWYSKDGYRKEKFHQKTLIKVTAGLRIRIQQRPSKFSVKNQE